jgi:hypothetical protein
MPISVDRLKHHVKILIGSQMERLLSKQYSRGHGPVSQLISAFSDNAGRFGVETDIVVAPVPVIKLAPEYFWDGEIETEYQNRMLSGDDLTNSAGVFSAANVEISFPTGMHQVKDHILQEAMPAPFVLTNPKYYYGLRSMHFRWKRSRGEGVLLSMPWHHNFYHWMIEILPRLISYDRCPRIQNVPLIMPHSAPRFVAESLRLAGYLPKTVFLRNGVYRFDKLHLLSILGRTAEVSTDAINWLNEKFVAVQSALIAPKRVYVSRRDANIRFVSNEPQLADVLLEFGFKTIVMSDLSLADQINVFRNAECIIGPHGAAFANLAFAKQGSIFIEWFSKGHFNFCFNRLSGIRKLKYGFLVGEPTGMGGFSINPGQLRAILSRALSG